MRLSHSLLFEMDLQISLSAFAFLFGELVQYCQTQVSNIGELERRWERSYSALLAASSKICTE